jgi:hypothetical protein
MTMIDTPCRSSERVGGAATPLKRTSPLTHHATRLIIYFMLITLISGYAAMSWREADFDGHL